jgi:hypothetical protein
MATTTNYSWTTPDDTALVKDGAAAIRSLGTAIDTTVFNNASAGIAKTIVDAKGDIIAATAADTVSRLAVGANDTVLTADSSTATGLKWAAAAAGGGMTLLSTTSLSGSSTVVSSINQSYKDLIVEISNPQVSASGWKLRVNPNSSAVVDMIGQYGSTNYTQLGGSIEIMSGGSGATGNDALTVVLYISNYTDAFGDRMPFHFYGGFTDNTISLCGTYGSGTWRGNTAITSMEILTTSSSFAAGTVRIYGVN